MTLGKQQTAQNVKVFSTSLLNALNHSSGRTHGLSAAVKLLTLSLDVLWVATTR